MAPRNGKSETPGRGTVTAEQLAAIVDLDVRRLQQLAQEGYVVRVAHGTYDFVASVRGIIRFWEERARGRPAAPEAGSLDEARLRREIALAESAEMDLRERRAEVVSLDFMEAEFNTRLMPVAAKLRNLPSFAPQLANRSPEEIAPVLEDVVEQMMHDLRVMGDGTIDPRPASDSDPDDEHDGT